MGGKYRRIIRYQIKIKTQRSGNLSFGEEIFWFPHKEVGNHSLWSGFYTEIFLAVVYPEIIMIIGRWSRNSFLWYIQIKFSEIRKCISDLMTGEKAF